MSVDNLRFVSSRSLSENDTNLLLKGVTMVIYFSQRSKRLQNVKNNYYPLDFNVFQNVNIFSGSRLFSTSIILNLLAGQFWQLYIVFITFNVFHEEN